MLTESRAADLLALVAIIGAGMILTYMLCRLVVIVFPVSRRYRKSVAFGTRDVSSLSVGLRMLRPGVLLLFSALLGAMLLHLIAS